MSGITAEMARAELSRRQSAPPAGAAPAGITPDMARAELAKRQNVSRGTSDKNMLEKAGDFAEQNITKPIENFAGATGQALVNAGIQGSNLFNPKFKTAPLDVVDTNSLSGKAGTLAGDVGAFIGGSNALTSGARGVNAAVNYIPKVHDAMKPILNALSKSPKLAATANIAGRAANAGATGYALSPDEDRARNAGMAALFGFGGDVAGATYGAAKGGINKLLAGTKTPAEAKATAAMVGDLPVSYGDIVGSPGLQKIQRGISKVPFSGTSAAKSEVKKGLEERSANLMESLRNGIPDESMAQKISTQVAKNASTAAKGKTKLYTELGDLAEKAGIKLDTTPELQKTMKEYFAEHGKALKEGGISPLTPSELGDFYRIAGRENPELAKEIGEKGLYPGFKEFEPMSFKTASNDISNYGDKAAAYRQSGENYRSKIYSSFKKSLNQDLENTIKNSENPEVSKKMQEAKEFFKKNHLPYERKEIRQIVQDKKGLEQIHNTLLSSVNKKVLSDLPPELKRGVAYLKFKNAVTEDVTGKPVPDAMKLFNAYNGLSKRQRMSIFDAKQRKEFREMGALAQIEKKMPMNTGSGLGAIELTTDATALLAHSPMLAAKLLGGQAIASLGARGVNKLLTNPQARNYLLNRAAAGQSKNPMMRNALRNALAGSQIGGQ